MLGDNPRVGAEKVRSIYSGSNSDLQLYGSREGVTVETKSLDLDIFSDEGSSGVCIELSLFIARVCCNLILVQLSGAAIFGIIVLVIVILAIVGIAAYFIMAKGQSTEFA